ncbi:MAG TPA: SxtJ family membrane protein [Gemmatimonadaceae bacterium]|nr:SxtJ family membrane protein [Gemmatimonadaceae bacterium]
MARRVSARLTRAEGRRFAFPVGGAFLALAGLAWWRGHPRTAVVVATIGAALVLAGAIAPTRLGGVERAWMALAHAISRVTTPLLMGVLYFLVLTPIAVAMRLGGYDPLRQRAAAGSRWVPREPGRGRSDLRRQF